ncbi:hypothetical protein [Streptomyces sp. NPDC052015]|uniref:hypothetical protein n=1 Tax=Streptomyces sp. NPDC052015 TaxID=3154755 RepID=UPI00342DEAB4
MTEPAKPAESGEPTPAELRALMAEATALQGRINDVQERLRASEETRHTAFRLDDAAGRVAQAGEALGETASDLARTRAARDPKLCDVPWGVCPDHGNTLRGSGGRAWCTDPTCGRSWDYDRLGNACAEPATHTVTDAEGGTMRTCDGHTKDVANRLDGAVITALSPDAGDA